MEDFNNLENIIIENNIINFNKENINFNYEVKIYDNLNELLNQSKNTYQKNINNKNSKVIKKGIYLYHLL